MELNIEVCRTLAVQYGLPLQYVVKEFYVFDVLSQITMLTSAKPLPSLKAGKGSSGKKGLVFKGGTALNKVYLEKIQRFSEDLDFDFPSENMQALRAYCKEIAEGLSGYDIKDLRRVKGTIQFYCAYESPLGKDHIRVDVASKQIIASRPLQIKPAVSLYTQRSVLGFFVYAVEDLMARKLHALCTRTEGKDVYDAFYGLPLCGKMNDALQKMLESENFKAADNPSLFIQKTIAALEKVNTKKLRNLTNPFIPFNNRPPDWSELKNEVIRRLNALR